MVFNNDATEFSSQFNLYGSTIYNASIKGAIGLRMDGVQTFQLLATIHNIENWGQRGSTLAGEYSVPQIMDEQEDMIWIHRKSCTRFNDCIWYRYINNVEIYDVLVFLDQLMV